MKSDNGDHFVHISAVSLKPHTVGFMVYYIHIRRLFKYDPKKRAPPKKIFCMIQYNFPLGVHLNLKKNSSFKHSSSCCWSVSSPKFKFLG